MARRSRLLIFESDAETNAFDVLDVAVDELAYARNCDDNDCDDSTCLAYVAELAAAQVRAALGQGEGEA